MTRNDKLTRRRFIAQASMASAALMVSSPGALLAQQERQRIKSRGYAAFDATGELRPWAFERRPLGDDDILIEINYASICHSDIHQMKGHWGPQQYPQVPGHEIVGVVAAVGRNVTKFEVGDRAGVGCMVDSCMRCDSCTHGEEQYCENGETLFTYGYPDRRSPTGITQGGYSTNIVVTEHFAVHIPDHIPLEEAAPLLEAPAEAIPLDNASVDSVLMTYTLCSIADVHAALAEIRRVLKPGGRLLFCEHGAAPDASVRRWQDRLNPLWRRLSGGCNLNRAVPGLLRQGGFDIRELEAMYIPGWRPASFNYRGIAKPSQQRET